MSCLSDAFILIKSNTQKVHIFLNIYEFKKYIWNGGESIEDNEKKYIVKCKLTKDRFDIFKHALKQNGETQQTALERLVYEYIGRNLISYISIKSLEKDLKNKYENNTKKENK